MRGVTQERSERITIRIEVEWPVYKAWMRAKAELGARTNAECLKKMLIKLGFLRPDDYFAPSP